jgi:hypothetical protein
VTPSPTSPVEVEDQIINTLSVFRDKPTEWPSTDEEWQQLEETVKELRYQLKLRKILGELD